LTQNQLANAANVWSNSVSRWERGHTEPSAEAYGAIADVTGVRFEWLARGVGPVSDDPARSDKVRSRIADSRFARQRRSRSSDS